MSDSDSDFTEHTLDSRTVYRGRLLHVLEDEVRMPDGASARREYIRHPGAVAMVPLLDRETVVLVRQYRYPTRRHFYEIPAGKIDAGEEPLQTGQRELREECGYEARVWQRLTTLDPCIGYSDERIELFLAQDLTRVERTPEDLYQDNRFPNYHFVEFVLNGDSLTGKMYRLADADAETPTWEVKDTFEVQAK